VQPRRCPVGPSPGWTQRGRPLVLRADGASPSTACCTGCCASTWRPSSTARANWTAVACPASSWRKTTDREDHGGRLEGHLLDEGSKEADWLIPAPRADHDGHPARPSSRRAITWPCSASSRRRGCCATASRGCTYAAMGSRTSRGDGRADRRVCASVAEYGAAGRGRTGRPAHDLAGA